ncbi:MAG: serine/threonine-protein phosphatase [Sedimentisphaerales bacterium]|nr:serine/threonine-protein phosphatase [Sedimentisphaerales bacterium]
MDRTESIKAVELPANFTDVLYMTDQGHIPSEVKRLCKLKKLSYRVLPIDRFSEVRDRLDLIGTVIIDTKDSVALKQQLVQIIELLEMVHIGVILLTGRKKMPVKSFSLSPTSTSFSVGGTIETVSVDELWIRISVNLSYRKNGSLMVAKPAVTSRQGSIVSTNKMAEQLAMTKVLADNLTEQLRLAGLVQQDFLPAKLPNTDELQWATIFLPAEWVSGDIYDIVRIDEQHIGFYIADIVGHGIPAALLTIFLKQALVMRETIDNNYRIFSPVEVMKNLNLRMAAQKLSGYQFATCCYCLLNTKTLQLTYSRAGHPYPILIRPGKEPEQLQIRGSLLGIFEQAEYVQGTVQLQPGDKLLLYSDGAESFMGRFDDQGRFGFDKEFCNIKDLPLTEMFDSINAAIQNQTIEPSEMDDITLIGLEMLPNVTGD